MCKLTCACRISMQCLLVICLIRLVSTAIITFSRGVGQCVLGAALRGRDHARLDQIRGGRLAAKAALYFVYDVSDVAFDAHDLTS